MITIENNSLGKLKMINKMGKSKAYKKQKVVQRNASEPVIAYTSNTIDFDIVRGECDDIKCAITGEELLDRLRPRIKALFC